MLQIYVMRSFNLFISRSNSLATYFYVYSPGQNLFANFSLMLFTSILEMFYSFLTSRLFSEIFLSTIPLSMSTSYSVELLSLSIFSFKMRSIWFIPSECRFYLAFSSRSIMRILLVTEQILSIVPIQLVWMIYTASRTGAGMFFHSSGLILYNLFFSYFAPTSKLVLGLESIGKIKIVVITVTTIILEHLH